MGWQQYGTQARMVRAAQALAGGSDPVPLIAADLGFASTSAFIRAFKAFAGETPSAYRQQAYARPHAP